MKNIITNFCLLILVGCTGQQNSSAASQVLAKVIGDKISAYRSQNELKATQQNAGDPTVSRKLFAGLVDRQLLVHEALKLDLSRAPKVIQAIEAAKAKNYAQALRELQNYPLFLKLRLTSMLRPILLKLDTVKYSSCKMSFFQTTSP